MTMLRWPAYWMMLCAFYGAAYGISDEVKKVISGITTGDVKVFTTETTWVTHMEADQYIAGNIVFADYHAIISSNSTDSTVIVGNPKQYGYKEGIGSNARFTNIIGLTQISQRQIILSDNNNHCLRIVDRATRRSSLFAGQCKKLGYQDELPALFGYPGSIIKDQKNPKQIIVVDGHNSALRSVDISSRNVQTLIKVTGYGLINGAIVQMRESGDILIPAERQILRYNYNSKSLSVLTGSKLMGYDNAKVNGVHSDVVWDILVLDKSTLIITDVGPNLIRIVDLTTNKSSSISLCTQPRTMAQNTRNCTTKERSFSLLNFEGNILIGMMKQILSVSFEPHSKDMKNKTVQGKTSTCVSKNITAYIGGNESYVKVEVMRGRSEELSEGYHTYNFNILGQHINTGCTVIVQVIKNETAPVCPDVIAKVISPKTKLATFRLSFRERTHTLALPVGRYPYTIDNGVTLCNITLVAEDYLLVRRVTIRADYDIECTLLGDNLARSTLESVAYSHNNHILKICQQDCSSAVGSQPELSCHNNTLSVTWPTDVTYNGTVTDVPAELHKTLTDRLIAEGQYPILSLVVTTKSPPIVYPTKTKFGAYATVALTSSCLQNKYYENLADTCG